MTCSSLEALFFVVDTELQRQALEEGAARSLPQGSAHSLATRRVHATPFAIQGTHSPSPPPLSDLKHLDLFNRSSSGAPDASGHTCASEMSDQEHFAALHDEDNSGMPIYPFLEDGLGSFSDHGRKYAHGALDAAASPSHKRSGNGVLTSQANHSSSHPGSNGNVYFPVNNGDGAGPQPLPLFQAQWAADRRAPEAKAAPQAAKPAKASARAAAAPKRMVAPKVEDEPEPEAPPAKKARLTGFATRASGTSSYRGVSWHTQTGRWKAQIKVAGKDVNLGRHKDEVEAARAYDRAAICARGAQDARLNFEITDYQHEIPTLVSTPLTELASTLRGVEARLQAQTSRYHGVRLNKRTSKWEAYIRVAGKHVHLGCYDSEVAAAQAFDQAALVRQAHNLGAMGGKPQLVTNFPPMIYLEFTNELFQLANPLNKGTPMEFNKHGGKSEFCRLEDKYVQNLLQKCLEQGGSLTAYPSIAS